MPELNEIGARVDFELLLSMPEHECRHGRCYGDGTPPCGCHPNEEAAWKEQT